MICIYLVYTLPNFHSNFENIEKGNPKKPSLHNRPLSNNDRKSSVKFGNPIICFVRDPMSQIRTMSSLFGTLGHNYVLCWWRVESGTFGSDRTSSIWKCLLINQEWTRTFTKNVMTRTPCCNITHWDPLPTSIVLDHKSNFHSIEVYPIFPSIYCNFSLQ